MSEKTYKAFIKPPHKSILIENVLYKLACDWNLVGGNSDPRDSGPIECDFKGKKSHIEKALTELKELGFEIVDIKK
ncbi:MAG: hypothetical protein R6U26_00750 [Candidatus Undinarchaeales archaeon]